MSDNANATEKDRVNARHILYSIMDTHDETDVEIIAQALANQREGYEKQIEELKKKIEKVRMDINWMLNNRKFLNPSVFDYLEAK